MCYKACMNSPEYPGLLRKAAEAQVARRELIGRMTDLFTRCKKFVEDHGEVRLNGVSWKGVFQVKEEPVTVRIDWVDLKVGEELIFFGIVGDDKYLMIDNGFFRKNFIIEGDIETTDPIAWSREVIVERWLSYESARVKRQEIQEEDLEQFLGVLEFIEREQKAN